MIPERLHDPAEEFVLVGDVAQIHGDGAQGVDVGPYDGGLRDALPPVVPVPVLGDRTHDPGEDLLLVLPHRYGEPDTGGVTLLEVHYAGDYPGFRSRSHLDLRGKHTGRSMGVKGYMKFRSYEFGY